MNPVQNKTEASETANEEAIRSTSLAGWLLKWLGRLLIGLVLLAVWLWCVGFTYCLDDNFPVWIARSLAGLIAVAFPLLLIWFRKQKSVAVLALFATFLICFACFKLMKPSHEREFGVAQAVLPLAELGSVEGNPAGVANVVVVKNIRTTRYGPVAPGRASHYDDTFDLGKLKAVWFGVDRFTSVEPLAHTFLSFEFEPGSHKQNFLAFSVETRREKNEFLYSPIRGIFNNYEVIYVIADEQDVLSVRSDVQEHVVQLYPVRATPEQIREMFVDMLSRANSIRARPEFYHTLTNNCTNNIVVHTNKVLDKPISAWQRGVICPGYSDWLAYQLGILDTDLSLEEAREKFRIDQRVKAYDGKSDFSEFIRGR